MEMNWNNTLIYFKLMRNKKASQKLINFATKYLQEMMHLQNYLQLSITIL